MITFENVGPGESLKALIANNVEFKDGQEDKYSVKKIVITIEAGGIPHMMVERYLAGSGVDSIVGVTAVSDDIEDGYAPTTFKNHYTIGEIEGDIRIKVAGPHAKHGQMNGRRFHKPKGDFEAIPENKGADPFKLMKQMEADEMSRLSHEKNLGTDK